MALTILDAVLLTIIPYSIIIFCNYKILKYLKYYKDALSPAARRVQTDLNRVLLAQAIIPIFTAFMPMSLHILSVIVYFDTAFATFIGVIFYAWIPVGNALSVLFFVTAYRKKLTQLVFRTGLSVIHCTPSSVAAHSDTS